MKVESSVDGVHMHLENKKVSFIFFWVIWILYTVVYMTKNCYSAAMASIVSEGVLTKSQTGLLTALFYLAYGPLQILGGIFADKYNPERLVKIGLVGAAISNTLIFFNQTYSLMLIAWTFNGTIQFALYPAVFKIVSSQLEAEYRIKGVYFLSLSSTSGMVLAYLVAAVVSKWQYNFALSAVALFLLAIGFHFVCNWVERYMVPDTRTPEERQPKVLQVVTPKISAWRLFWLSGFTIFVVVTALRFLVTNAINTLSATMLMESYTSISHSMGNILNILIIVSGVLGITLVNRFVYPRITHNEMTATVLLIAIALVPMLLICFTGKTPVFLIVICLCVTSAILTGSGLLVSHASAAFAKYGMNGLATGVYNALASLSIVAQSYGVVKIADYSGWNVACYFLFALLLIAGASTLIAIPLWKKFKQGRINLGGEQNE